jgi:hypothetical protein
MLTMKLSTIDYSRDQDELLLVRLETIKRETSTTWGGKKIMGRKRNLDED